MSALDIPNLLDQFSKHLVKDTVGIIEFCESDKYCNQQLYPRQRTLLKLIFLEDLEPYDESVIREWEKADDIEMSPKVWERMEYLKKNDYPHFRMVQLVGGRRSSKNYLTSLATLFKLYQLTQIDNLASHYGIPRGKEIYFSLVAGSMEQAKKNQFTDIRNILYECKPIVDQRLIHKVVAESASVFTPFDVRRMAAMRSAGAKIDADMASLRIQAFGTNSQTIRGHSTILAVFDEMAHFVEGESRLSDEQLFTSLVPSLQTFRKEALIFLNSSPYTKTGHFYKLWEDSMMLDPPETGQPAFPEHFSLQYPSWELYKDGLKDYHKRVSVLVDLPENDATLQQQEKADPDTFKVEYRARWADVQDSFLRTEFVERMFDPIATMDAIGRELVPQSGIGAQAAVGFTTYKGHADPSAYHDNFGVAVGHLEEIVNPATNILESHVVFDFINAFWPEDFKDETIDWLQVVPEITNLINSFRPFEFTFDQFESHMPIQILNNNLKKLGISDTNIYIKTATHAQNERRAMNFRTALNLGRVHAPHPQTYSAIAAKNPIDLGRLELRYLIVKNGKVDHPTIGPVRSKDVADCMMEVVDALIGDSMASIYANLDQPVQFGASGGYSGSRSNILNGNTNVFGEFEDWYPKRHGRQPVSMPERGIKAPSHFRY